MRCCLNWCRRGQALYDGFPEDDAVGRRGPDKSARYLRGIKEQEEEDSDDMDAEDEARLLSVLNPPTSYLNHPLLRPEAEIVATAKKADQLLQNRLAKDKAYVGIMKRIKNTSGAKHRIEDWIERGGGG
ncbi:hypothetical protein PI126_g17950 [Phytophthora idaei]|nr:hypothetical protein PI126_g17950 [Phytophthora idaei]